MAVRAELLGPPAVIVEGERVALPFDRAAALLCYLAFRSGWARRDEFIALLWPDVPDSRARHRFRQLLFSVRNKFPFADVETRGDRIRWSVPTDVATMQEAPNDAARVEANRGWFLEGFYLDDAADFEAWVEAERAPLHIRWRSAALRLTEDLLRDRRHEEALAILERVEQRDPLDEEVAQLQISLLREVHPQRAARRFQTLAEAMDRELGALPSEQTRAVAEGLGSPDIDFPVPSRFEGPGALPVGSTEFVGREEELAEAAELLRRSDCRMLTLFAPGGMGKTRMALELGRRHAEATSHRATFVSLVHANTSGEALASIAEALGVTVYGPAPVQRQIAEALGKRAALLILDNIEQLDLAQELTDLLEHAPGLTILATSRRRLAIQAEWSLALGGMRVPPGALDAEAPPFDPDAWDATRLFVRRARQRRRDLVLDDLQRHAVARIAARLGGMPLAIELAARWSDILLPTEIDAELAARVGLSDSETPLRAPQVGSDDRHRSIHVVLEQSWRRLGERKQEALRRLSVLQGFTLNAARAVAGADPGIVRELIDDALVVSLEDTSVRRFDMHPLVRSFCMARAEDRQEELEASRDAQARHYLGWAADVNTRILSNEAPHILARLYEEIDNLRASWLRAADRGFVDLLGAALKPVEFTFRSRTWYRAWGELLQHAHERIDAETLTHARIEMVMAANHLDHLDTPTARRVAKATLPRIDAFNDEGHPAINPHPPAEIRRILGHIALAEGRFDDAATWFVAALEILERDDVDRYFAARVADYLGTAHAAAGRMEAGRHWLERAVRELRTLNEDGALSVAAGNLARLELHTGSPIEARELALEALSMERKFGLRPRFFVEQLRTASDTLRVTEAYDEAAALLYEELDMLERNPMPIGPRRTAQARDRLGQIAYLQGDLVEARHRLRGALTPRACRLAILEGQPERAETLCADWLARRVQFAYLTLDLDRDADRAFVYACAAEAALAAGRDPDAIRSLLGRALDFAASRSLRTEIARAAALVGWFLAEQGKRAIGLELLAAVKTDPATDPETRALLPRLWERFCAEGEAPVTEMSAEPLDAVLENAVEAAGIDLSIPSGHGAEDHPVG